MEREPTLIYSPLNGHFTRDGVTVEVHIISSDLDPKWSLEVVNSTALPPSALKVDDYAALYRRKSQKPKLNNGLRTIEEVFGI
jgi:hypothetical protein